MFATSFDTSWQSSGLLTLTYEVAYEIFCEISMRKVTYISEIDLLAWHLL